MDAQIGNAEVVLHAHVELRGHVKTGGACGGIEQHTELMRDRGVRSVWTRDHVVDACPDLVTPVGAHATTALEQLLQLVRRRVQDQCAHRFQGYRGRWRWRSSRLIQQRAWDGTLGRREGARNEDRNKATGSLTSCERVD